MFVPIILLLFGVGIAQIEFFKESSVRNLDISLFPSNQRILYNNPGGDVYKTYIDNLASLASYDPVAYPQAGASSHA